MKRVVTPGGVGICYKEMGSGSARPLLLLHGFGCDHTFLARRLEFFSRSRPTIAVDLRGHGESDAPNGAYTPSVYVEDLSWLCERLRLDRPIVVGHSLGGTIALELAAKVPSAVCGVVMIDSLVFPPHGFIERLRPVEALLHGPDYLGRDVAGRILFRPGDDLRVVMKFAESVAATPRHVLAACFDSFVMSYDASAAAYACRVPVAYIGAETPLGDTARFKAFCLGLTIGQTVGSGHFSPLLVPHQINAMIRDFEDRVLPACGRTSPRRREATPVGRKRRARVNEHALTHLVP
ncbi:MAG: alpha/beta fold hydrolase [Janthinobacterium lividum]